MRNLLLLEWNKLKRPVLATLVLLTLSVCIMTSTLYRSYSLEADLESWEVGIAIIVFLFPLISVIPVCWLMYFERKDHFLMYTLPRVSRKRYLTAKWIVVAGSSGLIMFVSMAAGVITALYIKPDIVPFYAVVDPTTGQGAPSLELHHFMGSLFVKHPLIYGLLLSLWQGVLSAVVATMGFVISLYITNIFIILTGPFLYIMLENFLLQLFPLRQYRIYLSFNPAHHDASKLGYSALLAGPALALLLTGLMFVYYSRTSRNGFDAL
ncbi:ABC transporter permease [Paenibacillus donghaensis]|uniref:Uncharacterized protein n=1 Tax=Paenibacillus donghaensis TaxID=414771 RepID=A0A2Z2KTA1_9BACL|nr:ABC transporter permease [Paenibacillus donghaensis]ASA23971.1 hypothetical protein B9T62_26225 [Paenibacillus donghaensis]